MFRMRVKNINILVQKQKIEINSLKPFKIQVK